MEEDDFRELISVLGGELQACGMSGLSDPRLYVRRDPDFAEAVVLEPDTRLVEMLKAFGRQMAIEDRATYSISLERITDVVEGSVPIGAVVEPAREAGRDAAYINLADAPDLSKARALLAELLDELGIDLGPLPKAFV